MNFHGYVSLAETADLNRWIVSHGIETKPVRESGVDAGRTSPARYDRRSEVLREESCELISPYAHDWMTG